MINLNTNLLKGNIVKTLIIFAIPIFISNVFQQLYNTVDTMIVGNFLKDTSLAAIGACAAIFELMVGFTVGVGSGMSIVAARFFGAGDTENLKKSVTASIIIGVLISLFIMIISKICLMPLLRILDTPSEIINESYSYISTVTMFVGVMFLYNLASGLLRAIGNSVMPLVFLIISSILNIVLDLLFITKLNMGIRGTAIATVISQAVSGILCILYILKRTKVLVPSKKHFKFDKNIYKEILSQGLSMGFMLSIVSTGTVILQSSINKLGYLIIAGHTAARRLSSLCTMPIGTLAVSLATFISQNKGADKKERIVKAVRFANIMAIIYAAIISVILLFSASFLVQLLSGSKEHDVIYNGARYLMINAPFYSVLGILLNLRNALQGLGEKVIPLVSSIIEFTGKVIFVILFIPYLKYFGVIICEPVVWCFMCLQLWFSFYKNPYIKSLVLN
ncbi:MATE family efflux transporter [Clostridium sp. BJN0001]|uniref:MATE family efflux transporter n=1 Tax=Clostridium sp. BJN0001 TaxID=2930219 RepID=UPI001FD2D3BE|nr:MATE family efflux transporter [Clostridium sp. BJN0001]